MSETPYLPMDIVRYIMWWRAALQLYEHDSSKLLQNQSVERDFHVYTRDLREDAGVNQRILETDLLQFWIEARWVRSAKRRKIK